MNPTDMPSTQDPASPPDALRSGFSSPDRANEIRGPMAKAKRAAGRAVDRAKETATQAAGTGREAAAEKIGDYSERLRAGARHAGEEDPNIAHLANSAADRLQEAADYVRGADLERLRRDAADVAHRHPALFMGGMFAAGLVLGNLARASAQTIREEEPDGDDGHDAAGSQPDSEEMSAGVSDSFDPPSREEEPSI